MAATAVPAPSTSCIERRLNLPKTTLNPPCVISWGCGEHGQLGHGDTSNRPGPSIITSLIPTPQGHVSEPVFVAAGGSRTAVLDREGKLFVWGGKTQSEPGTLKPNLVAELIGCCGALHFVALVAGSREVLQWGNICGKEVPPSVVSGLEGIQVSQIVACGAFSFALSDNGKVFGWGCNSKGQLGLGDTKDRDKAQEVSSLSTHKIISIACGGQHSVFRSDSGYVFTCGSNKYGQLGLGDRVDRLSPQPVQSIPEIDIVACGDNHTLFAGKAGVFCCGRKGQCGLETEDNILKPLPIDIFNAELTKKNEKVNSICGNGAFNCSHTAILTDKGHLYTFGDSGYGQCGIWGSQRVSSPTIVDALLTHQVHQVVCGWMHTVVLSSSTLKAPTPPPSYSLLGTFQQCPPDVILHILGFLLPSDLAKVEQVNSVMKQFANSDLLWRALFDRKGYSVTPLQTQWEEKNMKDTSSAAYKIALHAQPPQ